LYPNASNAISHSHSVICQTVTNYYSKSSASFPGNPFPTTKQVAQCNSNPGGPIKLQSSTECDVNIPLFNPSNHIHRPTNRSQVRTCDHSSLTKFGYCYCGVLKSTKFELKLKKSAYVALNKYTPASFQPWPFEDHPPDQIHLRIQPWELFHLCIVRTV
jgi:hypothetical protein